MKGMVKCVNWKQYWSLFFVITNKDLIQFSCYSAQKKNNSHVVLKWKPLRYFLYDPNHSPFNSLFFQQLSEKASCLNTKKCLIHKYKIAVFTKLGVTRATSPLCLAPSMRTMFHIMQKARLTFLANHFSNMVSKLLTWYNMFQHFAWKLGFWQLTFAIGAREIGKVNVLG